MFKFNKPKQQSTLQQAASSGPTKWHEDTFYAFDTETTGIDVETSRIVSASLIEFSGEVMLSRHSWIINPGVDIPVEASNIHGITNEIAKNQGQDPGKAIAEIVEAIRHIAKHKMPLVVMNARYDLALLDRESKRITSQPLLQSSEIANLRVIDPSVLDKQTDPYRRGKRTLSALAAHYGVTISSAHNAHEDAYASAFVAIEISKNEALRNLSTDEIHAAQIKWGYEQAASLEKYFRQQGRNSVVSKVWPFEA